MMTSHDFVEQLFTLYQQRASDLSPKQPYSPSKMTMLELRKAAADFLHDASDEHRHTLEGAIMLCQTVGIINDQETTQLLKQLDEIK